VAEGAARADRYELHELLGEGASSRVYRAFDRETRSFVALKVLNAHLRTDEVSLERFHRELRITRQLNHPQIVVVYDLVSEPERTFLVMELLGGSSLKTFIALEHPVELELALDCLRQILEVLAVCHAQDVVHRDLKPQNVFIDKGRIKLLDFGIARVTSLRDLTRTGTSLGSPEYMAPELFARATHDPRTDLYAVGVVAFELLTGRLPFQGDTLAMLFRAHREGRVPPLRELRPDAPPWLEAWIGRLLAKRAHERYQSAEEAADDLAQRRVLSRELPELPRRRCLECDEETLDELAVCLRCGADRTTLREPGRCEIHCRQGEDPQRLRAFLADCLEVQSPPPRRGQTLLVRGAGSRAAEVLRRRAARRGIYLEVRRSSPFDRIGPLPQAAALVALGCGALPFASWRLHEWWWSLPWGYSARFTLFGAMAVRFLFLLAAVAPAVAGPYLAWRRVVGRTPLLRDPGARLLRRLRDYAWLQDLAPALARAAAGERTTLAGLIERTLLLMHDSRPPQPALDVRLQGLLRAAARLETLAAEIAARLDDAELARSTQRYDALRAALEREAEPAARQRLEREQAQATRRLRAFARLEEAHSSLVNRLVRTEAAFNRLVGARLVLSAPFDELELATLVESLERTRDEVAAQQELERELGAELERELGAAA
jgi:tRNA A-37 threonylcarbamoyl transferase component Bud32